ncbi:MAG: hypothetical protein ACTSVV_13375 [Promethearchaeota archaeon]
MNYKKKNSADIINFQDYFLISEKNEDLNLNLEEFLILFFGFSPNKKVNGKTRFQKLIYLLNDEFKIFNNLHYFRYYYGPYSEDLEIALSNLRTNEYIDEKIIYLNVFLSKYQINRSLSEKGRDVFKLLKKEKEKTTIDKMKKMTDFLKEKGYYEMKLSELLTIVYKKAGYI